MCAAARTKRQAVAAAPLPVVAMDSVCTPEPSRHPSGIILGVVGTAGTDCWRSCKDHTCCGNVLDNDVLLKLWHEQILVPDAITRWGMLECLTAAWKALSRVNAKGKGTNDWVIRSLDD
jgi:hypothetical protein